MCWPRPAGRGVRGGRTDTAPGRTADPGAAILHPGAKSASRRWPSERFASVARWLRTQGLRVVITGSAGERPLGLRVAAEAGLDPEAVVAGRTDLACLARLVAEARLLVSGDTGVAHLATVYGTPSVRLFGPVSPALWGPLIDLDLHECLWKGESGDPHGDRLDPGLDALGPTEVREACERALRRGRTWSQAGA
ncbi:glycosyltransferase family 9 protein [Nocardiopsis sp. NPDC006938]